MRKVILLTAALGLTTQVAFGTIVGEYLFNGSTLNSAGAGFALTGTGGTYTTETVFGQTKSVLSLPGKQGLDLDVSALTDKSRYTIIMDVSSDTIMPYNKLLSLDGGISDSGVYLYDNGVTFFPLGTGAVTISAGQWVRVALSYDGTTMNLYYGDPNSYTLASTGVGDPYYTLFNTIQFFQDDSGTGFSESYALKVSSIWVNDAPMTQSAIAEQGGAIPEPATFGLLGAGTLACLAFVRRRFSK